MYNYGDRIVKLRGKESQGTLAKRAKVGRSTIARYEENKVKSPDYDTVSRIAHALEVTARYLLGETDDPVEGKISYDIFLSRQDFKDIVKEAIEEYMVINRDNEITK